MKKVCSKCGKEKNIEDFHKHKTCLHNRRGVCKECSLIYRNTVGKNKQLRKRYGLNIKEYNELFEKQHGSCAICGRHQSELTVSLAVDHCHDSGSIRGLLCYNCNMGLGRFKDSKELLIQALSYLTSREQTTT